MPSTLSHRIETAQARLTDADQRLLDVLLGHPTEAAMLSASDVARRAGVHAATAVRLAQKLGYGGYLDLRSALRTEAVASDGARRVAETLAGAPADLLSSLVASEVDTLLGLLKHVDYRAVEETARSLLLSRTVTIYAQGNAVVLAELLDRRLRRAGFRTSLATGQGRELAERLIGLRREDALVAFAFRRIPRELDGVLRHARSVGARSVLIADQAARRASEAADHVLAAPRGRADEFLTLTVPMVICNALILTIARIDGGQSVSALDALEKLTSSLETR